MHHDTASARSWVQLRVRVVACTAVDDPPPKQDDGPARGAVRAFGRRSDDGLQRTPLVLWRHRSSRRRLSRPNYPLRCAGRPRISARRQYTTPISRALAATTTDTIRRAVATCISSHFQRQLDAPPRKTNRDRSAERVWSPDLAPLWPLFVTNSGPVGVVIIPGRVGAVCRHQCWPHPRSDRSCRPSSLAVAVREVGQDAVTRGTVREDQERPTAR